MTATEAARNGLCCWCGFGCCCVLFGKRIPRGFVRQVCERVMLENRRAWLASLISDSSPIHLATRPPPAATPRHKQTRRAARRTRQKPTRNDSQRKREAMRHHQSCVVHNIMSVFPKTEQKIKLHDAATAFGMRRQSKGARTWQTVASLETCP